MPKFLWAHFCERPIIDSKTNMLSLIGLIRIINVPEIPIVIPQSFYVVSLWEKEASYSESKKAETFTYKIIVTQQSPRPSKEGLEHEITIPKDKKRTRSICGIAGIPIKKDDELNIIIYLKSNGVWKKIYTISVDIKKKI